ncbi:cytochrome c oxidase subunit 3 [Pseudaminobacter sp. 19-2017]|uniref:Cytochrome c oxidase subunit 3 n=1 Tax=Pseudaminobacter soli (ex Zhang et al. 2022) TaxID=2831468 RepID=A0A942DZZ3_9HYPH|nr:cytochrome c oxidase subunit 3 [Pseudaminobacter soli]MBS3650287.1 cytochrome c oxidase subunit 3 [Pseudaminobacter soli]
MRQRQAIDLSDLPTYGMGSRSPTWWGTLGFMALEGTGFVLAAGAYLYLAYINPAFPLSAPVPNHWPGTIVTLLLLASAVPNHMLRRWANDCDMPKVRIGLVVMSIFGILPLIVRWFEFPALNIWWDSNAYGSMLWVLLGLHTTHLITDVGDTIVLTALMFTRHGYSGRRFGDVDDNVFYWDFVVITWLPIYFLIYWLPRFS